MDHYVFRCAPPTGLEHLQQDPLRRHAFAASLDCHLHVHRVLTGRDRLVPCQGRSGGEQPLIGDRSSGAGGVDLASNRNPAPRLSRTHDRDAGHLQRRVVESQIEHYPARREQNDSERGSENLAHQDAPMSRRRVSAARRLRSRGPKPRARRCGGNTWTISDQVLRRRNHARPIGHIRGRRATQCRLRFRLRRCPRRLRQCRRTFRQGEPRVGSRLRRRSGNIIEPEPGDQFVLR